MRPWTRLKLALITLILTAAGPITATAAEVYYCPWSDEVVRLEFAPDRSKIHVSGPSRNNVKIWLPVAKRNSRFSPYEKTNPSGNTYYFRQILENHVYEFELVFWSKYVDLWNRRVDIQTGGISKQSGMCMLHVERKE